MAFFVSVGFQIHDAAFEWASEWKVIESFFMGQKWNYSKSFWNGEVHGKAFFTKGRKGLGKWAWKLFPNEKILNFFQSLTVIYGFRRIMRKEYFALLCGDPKIYRLLGLEICCVFIYWYCVAFLCILMYCCHV